MKEDHAWRYDLMAKRVEVFTKKPRHLGFFYYFFKKYHMTHCQLHPNHPVMENWGRGILGWNLFYIKTHLKHYKNLSKPPTNIKNIPKTLKKPQ